MRDRFTWILASAVTLHAAVILLPAPERDDEARLELVPAVTTRWLRPRVEPVLEPLPEPEPEPLPVPVPEPEPLPVPEPEPVPVPVPVPEPLPEPEPVPVPVPVAESVPVPVPVAAPVPVPDLDAARPRSSVPAARIGNPRPPYPAWALSRRLEGEVLLALEVLEDGSAGTIRVVSQTGDRRFAAAAVDAIREYRFRPRTIGGAPVRSEVEQRVEYRWEER